MAAVRERMRRGGSCSRKISAIMFILPLVACIASAVGSRQPLLLPPPLPPPLTRSLKTRRMRTQVLVH